MDKIVWTVVWPKSTINTPINTRLLSTYYHCAFHSAIRPRVSTITSLTHSLLVQSIPESCLAANKEYTNSMRAWSRDFQAKKINLDIVRRTNSHRQRILLSHVVELTIHGNELTIRIEEENEKARALFHFRFFFTTAVCGCPTNCNATKSKAGDTERTTERVAQIFGPFNTTDKASFDRWLAASNAIAL